MEAINADSIISQYFTLILEFYRNYSDFSVNSAKRSCWSWEIHD
jgi:hypothetical protein